MFFKLILSVTLTTVVLNQYDVKAGTAGDKAMKQEFYDNIFEHPWPTTYIGKCYYAFMLRKIDLLSTTGPFNVENFESLLRTNGTFDQTTIRQLTIIANHCKNLGGLNEWEDERCKSAETILKCFSEKATERGVDAMFLTKFVRDVYIKLTPPADTVPTITTFIDETSTSDSSLEWKYRNRNFKHGAMRMDHDRNMREFSYMW